MKKALLIISVIAVIFACEPPKDPAPAPILGKSFVEIQTPNSNIYIGDTLPITAKFTNEKNETSTPAFVWSSSKPDVATVSQSGLVKAIKVGQTFLISEYSTKKDTLIITVLSKTTQTISGNNNNTTTSGTNTVSGNNTTTGSNTTTGNNTSTTTGTSTTSGTNTTVDAVIIIAQTSSMQLNGTQQLQAQVYNSNSDLLTGKSVAWASSDNTVLEITSAGLITAKKSGIASITATSNGVSSLAYSITVNNSMRMATFSGLGSDVCTGIATLKYDAGGNLKLDFSTNFFVSSGPDLYVYLANISAGTTSEIVASGIEVAILGSNTGARSYTVPSGTGINTYKYVIVHCKQYSHTFGNGELK